VAKRIDASAARMLFLKNDLEPLEDFPGSQKPWKSKCLITGKIVSPTYGKVRDFGHRCIYCSRGVVDSKQAVLTMNNSGFIPQVPFPGSNKPWKSKCKNCKKITSPTYWNVFKGIGCKFCSGRAVDPVDAVDAMKKRGFDTLEPFPGATKKWLVRCQICEREFKTIFHSLNTTNGCKYCAGNEVIESDLVERLRELRLKPLESYQSAKIPWKCKCLVCGHIVQPTWSRIKSGRGHCAYCAQRRVDIPQALKFMKSINLKPIVDFPGNNKPWLSKCLICKNEVAPRWSDVRQGQGGCSNCADYGLNYLLSGYLYVITNPKLQSHKIGIANSYKTNQNEDRLKRHEKHGWILVKKYEFEKVRTAYEIEKEILKWLRVDLSLPFHLAPKMMPQGGFTETISSEYLDVGEITKKVEEVIRSL
jgi:hypothetical protein